MFMKLARFLPVLLSLALLLVAVLLPNTALRQMRMDHQGFNLVMGWAEMIGAPINAVHLVIFCLLGMSIRIAMPDTTPGRLLAGVGCFAALSEMVQWWVPGRTARMSDLVQDVIGALVGVLLVIGVKFLWRRGRRSPRA